MKVTPHVLRLYARTMRKYKKLVAKLRRDSTSPYQRKTFLHKLKKLLRRLRELEVQLKLATATGVLALMLNSSPVRAQEAEAFEGLGPFIRQPRSNNPLREPIFTNNNPKIAAVDYDKDGDMDVVMVEYDEYSYYGGGYLRYFENQSKQGSTAFIERFDEENPFGDIRALTWGAAPSFADLDGDGDADLVLGQHGSAVDYKYGNSGLEYFRNDNGEFKRQTGEWDNQTKSGNPFGDITGGWEMNPVIIDFDKDGDIDLLVGSRFATGQYPDYTIKYLQYYQNNGAGSFTPVDWTFDTQILAYWDHAIPAVADVDGDGDYDLLIGGYYDEALNYYVQVSPGNFESRFGEWNPGTKTGSPMSQFQFGKNPSALFLDFNNDGLLDLFVADDEGYYGYKYSDHIINYYENQGQFVFEQKDDMDNPFDGVYVKDDASPQFVDIDGDGDLDVLIGNKYNYSYYDYQNGGYIEIQSSVTFLRKDEDGFKTVGDEENPFDHLEVYSHFVPQAGDVDGDGDLDLLSANFYGEIVFFRNTDGEYEEDENNPFVGIEHGYWSTAKLVDIDNDEDLDLFVANTYGEIKYYKNTGTPTAPNYVEMPEQENPLEVISGYTWNTPFMHLNDIDHDGDLDVIHNGAWPDVESEAVVFTENTGSASAPAFTNVTGTFLRDLDDSEMREAQIAMADADDDGDLDLFVGNGVWDGGFFSLRPGTIFYFENQNIPAETSMSDTPLAYNDGEAPLLIAGDLTISDEDNDLIVQATVTIEDHDEAESLNFTAHPEISGSFDPETGVLTLRGKSTMAAYQSVLRTVTFESHHNPAGRRKAAQAIVSKTISISVFDQDFTRPVPVSRIVELNVVADGEVIVYNAVAPNSTGDNKFMRIVGLPSNHKVTIFTRWGDKVYETVSYSNSTTGDSFRGLNNDGKVLSSGTYFYVIEIPGQKQVRGYLTLKQ